MESMLLSPYLLAGLVIGFVISVIYLYASEPRLTTGVRSIKPNAEDDSPGRRIAKAALIIISLIAALVAVVAYTSQFRIIQSQFAVGAVERPTHVVYAQSGFAISDAVPWILVGVFVIMIFSFLVAVAALLWLPNNPENEKRINSADNIVKTFGGFFIGSATSLLNINPT